MSANLHFDNLPDDALIRQNLLVKRGQGRGVSLLPFSAATLWRKVKNGSFPRPIKLGVMTVWRVGDVRQWLRDGASTQRSRQSLTGSR